MFLIRVIALARDTLDSGGRRMSDDSGADDPRGNHPDLVGILLDAELLDGREPVVEAALVPEAVFGAADAAVAGLDWKRNAAVPAYRRTSIVGGGTLAAHLVEAESLAGGVVIPFLDKLPGIEMRAA